MNHVSLSLSSCDSIKWILNIFCIFSTAAFKSLIDDSDDESSAALALKEDAEGDSLIDEDVDTPESSLFNLEFDEVWVWLSSDWLSDWSFLGFCIDDPSNERKGFPTKIYQHI